MNFTIYGPFYIVKQPEGIYQELLQYVYIYTHEYSCEAMESI